MGNRGYGGGGEYRKKILFPGPDGDLRLHNTMEGGSLARKHALHKGGTSNLCGQERRRDHPNPDSTSLGLGWETQRPEDKKGKKNADSQKQSEVRAAKGRSNNNAGFLFRMEV